jgi:hypothetical protein
MLWKKGNKKPQIKETVYESSSKITEKGNDALNEGYNSSKEYIPDREEIESKLKDNAEEYKDKASESFQKGIAKGKSITEEISGKMRNTFHKLMPDGEKRKEEGYKDTKDESVPKN